MEQKARFKKRPCRVCGRWFMPNPRLGDRQKTCGTEECKQKWHAAKCAEWYRRNRTYFKEIYLRNLIEASSNEIPCSSRPPVNAPTCVLVPLEVIQEVMGPQQSVIINYISGVLLRGVQEVIRAQHTGIVSNSGLLVGSGISRGDSKQLPHEVSFSG